MLKYFRESLIISLYVKIPLLIDFRKFIFLSSMYALTGGE